MSKPMCVDDVDPDNVVIAKKSKVSRSQGLKGEMGTDLWTES